MPRTVNTFEYYKNLNNKLEIEAFEKEIVDTVEQLIYYFKLDESNEWTFVRGINCQHLKPFALETTLSEWQIKEKANIANGKGQHSLWRCPDKNNCRNFKTVEFVQDYLVHELFMLIK